MQSLNLAFPVYRHGRVSPGGVAVVVDDQIYTYQALALAAGRVGTWFRSIPKKQGRAPRLGVLAARSFETYVGILGAAWGGGTYVPLNPRQPIARLASILRRAGLDAIVVDDRGAPLLAELADVLPSHVLVTKTPTVELAGASVTNWRSLDTISEPEPPDAIQADHPAYIMFTSGTTGVPKGVVVTAANVAHFLSCTRSIYHFGPDDRVGQFCETSFDVSLFEIFAAWDAGASLHIVPESQLMAPAAFIRKHALTVWSSVPSVILMLMRLKQLTPGSFPSLRVSYFIGEGLPVASALAWQAAAPNSVVDNQYGPTEATVACIYHRLTNPPIETRRRGTLSIGDVYPGIHAAIIGPEGQFLDANEDGELALSGPQVAAGYLDDPAQTARRFPHLHHPTLGASRWYLTGDLARFDSEGRFHCLGRIDNQVKIMGHRVELEEIEAHLRATCGSDLVAAVAWPIVDGHAAGIVAFMCGGKLSGQEVREELRRRIPAYMVPRKVMEVETLPLSTNGKVDRKALCNSLEGQRAYVDAHR